MSSNPDPEQENITGLEPGGGVPPGETPPAEGSMSMDQGHDEGAPKKSFRWIWLTLIAVVVVLFILLIVGYVTHLFGLLALGTPGFLPSRILQT
ncbi:DUF6480 family protein [Paenarthrobacter sp. Z7-10]|uniref:DUF6480 family protein n=1 Tax=Paenarthrobacter sp. Z7-10 TaxID=2787635 RepID=UPI0022A9527F|nr:DUF6480 family protein [Paenarthrobacter sp. Z7-10]